MTNEDKVLESVNKGEDHIFITLLQNLRNHKKTATDPGDQRSEAIDYEVNEVVSLLSERIHDAIVLHLDARFP